MLRISPKRSVCGRCGTVFPPKKTGSDGKYHRAGRREMNKAGVSGREKAHAVWAESSPGHLQREMWRDASSRVAQNGTLHAGTTR